jgi:hypothetical protein
MAADTIDQMRYSLQVFGIENASHPRGNVDG